MAAHLRLIHSSLAVESQAEGRLGEWAFIRLSAGSRAELRERNASLEKPDAYDLYT